MNNVQTQWHRFVYIITLYVLSIVIFSVVSERYGLPHFIKSSLREVELPEVTQAMVTVV